MHEQLEVHQLLICSKDGCPVLFCVACLDEFPLRGRQVGEDVLDVAATGLVPLHLFERDVEVHCMEMASAG